MRGPASGGTAADCRCRNSPQKILAPAFRHRSFAQEDPSRGASIQSPLSLLVPLSHGRSAMFDLKSVRRAFVVAGIVALLDAGAAQSALLELSGFGTPVIDGVISPGEWVSAGQLDFTANTPFGGHTPATLFVMNDASNLYLAVRFERNVLDPGNSMDFEFDNNNGGKAQNGDDLILFNPDLGVLSDEFRANAPPCPAG